MHNPQDPHDPWSSYRPDMDQYRGEDPKPLDGWWIPVSVVIGTIIIVLLSLWVMT